MSKPFNFESAIKDLETLVAKMEDDSLSLEESLKCFEQGVSLTKQCQSALKAAEQKIEVIANQLAQPDAAEQSSDT